MRSNELLKFATRIIGPWVVIFACFFRHARVIRKCDSSYVHTALDRKEGVLPILRFKIHNSVKIAASKKAGLITISWFSTAIFALWTI